MSLSSPLALAGERAGNQRDGQGDDGCSQVRRDPINPVIQGNARNPESDRHRFDGALCRGPSSMHRDDFSTRGLSSMTVQTQLPFEVNGATVWLIDDVLYTGRTIRAVLNELFDYGRPAAVKLAVLVDRGQRELPVEANVAIARAELPATQLLELSRTPQGQLTFDVEAIAD